ncbi:DNA-cytosine methyltransferase (plasmid) [Calothrix sp. NIES-4071]|nr:DNA-cytosine methyltransferase [Calothrix sp. NIES-4071]BAZ64543.1 DNA-cytosine methyltransferase [Calothrix sp. NIES-4105]
MININSLRIIDLFAGCGGMSLGFANAKLNIIGAVDNWKPAINVYRKNFTHPIHNLDIGDKANWKFIRKTKCNFITGSPPCQDFSSAGSRNEDSGRGDLSIRFAELIEYIQPSIFVMENVERYQKSKKYKQVIEILKRNKYGLTEKVFNAAYCGVPQNRQRYICVGVFNGADHELLPYLNAGLSSKPMTVRDYFGDSLNIEHYYRHARSYKRRAVFSISEPSPTIRGTNRPIPPGYKGHPSDTAPINSKLRPLTTFERAAIQTFPSNFDFSNETNTNLEEMIGNAVPVKLAEFIANAIKSYLQTHNAVFSWLESAKLR